MPITVVSGPPTVFGPGVGIIVRTSVTGPIPVDWTWRIEVHPHGDEINLACVQTAPIWSADQHERRVWWEEDPDGGAVTLYARYVSLNTNDLVDLQMQLIGSDGVTVEDSGTVTSLRWDTSTSASRLLPQAQTGLSELQQQQLANAEANTQVTVAGAAAGGGDLLVGLGQLLQGVPPNVTNRHGSILVSGQGAIARGTEPFSNFALGFEWHWNTLPAGVGQELGNVDVLEERIVQWRTIDEDTSGQLFQRDVVASEFDGVRYVWGIHSPVTLEWYVIPGGVVELSFLVPAFG